MKTIKTNLLVFITLLILSGVTAFPIHAEIDFLFKHKQLFPGFLEQWIESLNAQISSTPQVMFYGTDWLAFAHLVISLFFIPVYFNPVQYRVNVVLGMIACVSVFPIAFICGPIREIPFFHQLIDCSFGVFGFLYLYFIHSKIKSLRHHEKNK